MTKTEGETSMSMFKVTNNNANCNLSEENTMTEDGNVIQMSVSDRDSKASKHFQLGRLRDKGGSIYTNSMYNHEENIASMKDSLYL